MSVMVLFISSSLFFSLAFSCATMAAISCFSRCLLCASRISGVAGAMKTGDLTRGLDGPGTGAMKNGDLAWGLSRPLDGPRADAAALLYALGVGAGGFGALNGWLQVGPVEGGRSFWS